MCLNEHNKKMYAMLIFVISEESVCVCVEGFVLFFF